MQIRRLLSLVELETLAELSRQQHQQHRRDADNKMLVIFDSSWCRESDRRDCLHVCELLEGQGFTQAYSLTLGSMSHAPLEDDNYQNANEDLESFLIYELEVKSLPVVCGLEILESEVNSSNVNGRPFRVHFSHEIRGISDSNNESSLLRRKVYDYNTSLSLSNYAFPISQSPNIPPTIATNPRMNKITPIDILFNSNAGEIKNFSQEVDKNQRHSQGLRIGRLFVSGDRSNVGKSTMCLGILSSLLRLGVKASDLAYIKPVTQNEDEQPVSQFCSKVGIAHRAIGPVVFYKGFTRAFLAGETDSAEILLQKICTAVDEIGKGKKLVIVDGVGYPSVGSICCISNADVARALNCPVLLIGKAGVGDAVDSYNLNAAYFESFGVQVLGGIFNKFASEGFYNLESCKLAISSYFETQNLSQFPYGFLPMLTDIKSITESNSASNETLSELNEHQQEKQPSSSMEDGITKEFLNRVNLQRLVLDIWNYHQKLKITESSTLWSSTRSQPNNYLKLSKNQTTTTEMIGVPGHSPSTRPNAHKVAPKTFFPIKDMVSSMMEVSSEPQPPIPVERKKRTREDIEQVAFSLGAKRGGG